jgi:hypothetical protein
MTHRIAIFTDLDDTLFQTARKISQTDMAGAVQVAQALNGQHGLMTQAQAALSGWVDLDRAVPVTARGSEAFSRVALLFGGPAIVANGAVILDADGAADPEWQDRVLATLAPHREALGGLPDHAHRLAANIGAEVRTWLVEEPACGGVYAVVKVQPGTPETALSQIAPVLRETVTGAWRLHLNGNNLALIPPGISKAAATRFVLARMRQAGPVLAIGMGDSSSDLEFMRLCDLWMTPTGSQLDRAIAELVP